MSLTPATSSTRSTREGHATPAAYDQATTLCELLRLRAARDGARDFHRMLVEDEAGARTSFGQLDAAALAIAGALQPKCERGARVLLLYPPGPEFLAAFFGSLYAGAIAVPLYPPSPAQLQRTARRLTSIARDAGATLLLTPAAFMPLRALLREVDPTFAELPWLAHEQALQASPGATRDGAAHDVAFLQYTSGSTGAPKGVMVTHENAVHNIRAIYACLELSASETIVSWLPPYHDMGLIGVGLYPLYSGSRVLQMSPVDFLKRPVRWLRALSEHGAEATVAPNFAYELCLRKIGDDDCEGLDLSHVRLALNGAEPVRADTLQRFCARFARHGFRPRAFLPCYGLAEATLMVTGKPWPRETETATFDKAALAAGALQAASAAPASSATLVSCGRPALDTDVRIVDRATLRECAEGVVGEIWMKGPGKALGYWGKPEDSAAAFGARLQPPHGEGDFLRTGDLGCMRGGELYVVGRAKDVIVIHGKNHHPQDIELTAERAHAALRPGCSAAFAYDVADREAVALVQEVETEQPSELHAAAGAIRTAVYREHGLRLDAVALVARGAVPKTTSGKTQRSACRERFLARELPIALLSQHAFSRRNDV
jgi:acyl-CoA synthetase (AMP-forming)/AMP-acid ligase II